MQWLKGKAFTEGSSQAPFIVGSDRWMGRSSSNPVESQDVPPVQGQGSGEPVAGQGSAAETAGRGGSSLYPGVAKYSPGSEVRRSGSEDGRSGSGLPPASSAGKGYYPVIYTGLPDTRSVEEAVGSVTVEDANPVKLVEEKQQVEAHEDVLVKIPGAIVHLIDEEDSLHLGTGDLQLVRLTQEGNGIAVFVSVGDELQWPLFKDEAAVKLDPTHYFFSMKVPSKLLDEDEDLQRQPSDASSQGGMRGLRREGSGDVQSFLASGSADLSHSRHQRKTSDQGLETLNYGVTFSQPGVEAELKELDGHLARYSLFSAPTVVEKDPARDPSKAPRAPPPHSRPDGSQGTPYTEGKPYLPPPAAVVQKDSGYAGADPVSAQGRPSRPTKPPVQAKIVTVEELNGHGQPVTEPNSAAFWTTLAPNVAEYSSSPARAIAQGSGHIIKGLFWVSQTTVSHLEKGGAYMREQGWVKPRTKGPVEMSPRTLKNMKRVRKMSKMTSKVAKSVLSGVVMTTGVFTGAVVNSKAGNKFFKLLPGEVALVSLDAFGKVFDAVEHAGRAVFKTSSSVTTDLVSHRYGPQAAEFAEDGMKATGHFITTAWTVSKLRKAFNPKSMTKTGLAKSVLKAAVGAQQTTGATGQ